MINLIKNKFRKINNKTVQKLDKAKSLYKKLQMKLINQILNLIQYKMLKSRINNKS